MARAESMAFAHDAAAGSELVARTQFTDQPDEKHVSQPF